VNQLVYPIVGVAVLLIIWQSLADRPKLQGA
jgi:hypothetical protein